MMIKIVQTKLQITQGGQFPTPNSSIFFWEATMLKYPLRD
ncbi:hypothetical protein COXBURSA331_A0093 [Coxiella burnetii RSA 331]|nr:hypothetical protein COXBURSA331_A0093 [Coxiella burnetii RSA 331]